MLSLRSKAEVPTSSPISQALKVRTLISEHLRLSRMLGLQVLQDYVTWSSILIGSSFAQVSFLVLAILRMTTDEMTTGVYDGLSARIALETGFDGMYMTGAGTTASRLGAADLGIAQLSDMSSNAEMIANLEPFGPPLIADMDTGYGGPLIIARAVQQYHRAGVAAFHIEDQIAQKRCGHLSGKEVVDVETYIQRIKACVSAAARLRSDIVIIARTDALQSRGFDDCIARLKRARDEGADMGILEGVSTKEQALQAVNELAPWPLCYNSVENGHSPLISVGEAQAMGYRAIIFSFAGISPAYTAIKSTFDRLKTEGVTGSGVTPKAIFQVCGLEESIMVDTVSGGSAFAKGV